MLLLAFALVAAPTGVQLNLTGFDDGDLKAIKAGLAKQTKACGLEVEVIELPAPCEDDCLTEQVGTRGGTIIAVEALRFGNDIDITERRLAPGGTVEKSTRQATTKDFEKTPLSTDACTAAAVVEKPKEEPKVVETPQQAPQKAALMPDLHPGWGVTVAGAVVTLVGLAGFGLDAATVEDPTSQGSDKERAAVTGWIWLGLAGVGVAGAGGGAAWALME